MADILAWQPNQTCDVVLRHLLDGGCVLLPTEGTYALAISALNPAAAALPGPAAVVVAPMRLLEWLPLLRGAGLRLMRKPEVAPFILRADAGFRGGLWSRLPEQSRRQVVQDGALAVWTPRHPIWTELAAADVPLIAVATDLSAVSADAIASLGVEVACAVDAGPGGSVKKPSIARAEGRRCQLIEEGSLTRAMFDELAACRILFICTGNTCRSPMAAGLCAKLLADHLGCSANDLPRHGFVVQSAGIAAMMGAPASPDAVRVAAEFGADIASHQSSSLTLDTLIGADHIFTMTAGHWHTINSIPLAEMPRPRLLSPDDEDVPDPIGGELADYRLCAEQILASLRRRLPQLLES